jgi:CheY-like chemotaxis protein
MTKITYSVADEHMVTWRTGLDILLVEDDDGHAELITDILKETCQGKPVRWFKDGQAIVDFLFAPGKIPTSLTGYAAVLILDIRIPKLDGIEVLRRIKLDAGLKNIPVIMLTTTDDPEEVARCYRLGCNAYICKPVDIEQFTRMISSLGGFINIMKVTMLNPG